jgi:polyphosphate kinase 2 (PPK2 family)
MPSIVISLPRVPICWIVTARISAVLNQCFIGGVYKETMGKVKHKLKYKAQPRELQVIGELPARPLRLAELNMDSRLDQHEYRRRKAELEVDLLRLQGKVVEQGIPVLIIVEGLDAAGKGGAIKRLTNYLDPRWVRVHNLARPSSAEQAYHWLRRYAVRLPRRGHIGIFDDYSWYGRTLVETIEQTVTPEESQRAIGQIVDYERWLAEDGYCIIKFWPHITPAEQQRRFERRKADPLRSWKLTPDDWANNMMYEHYSRRADELFERTHAPYAPWHLIPANDKRFARISIMQTVAETLERWPALAG